MDESTNVIAASPITPLSPRGAPVCPFIAAVSQSNPSHIVLSQPSRHAQFPITHYGAAPPPPVIAPNARPMPHRVPRLKLTGKGGDAIILGGIGAMVGVAPPPVPQDDEWGVFIQDEEFETADEFLRTGDKYRPRPHLTVRRRKNSM